MRRLAVLLLPVLALAACVPPGYGPYSGGGRYSNYGGDRWYDDSSIPLAARIVPDGQWFAIELNRPAHVAMFEILPGRGVALVYPTYSREEAFMPSGYSALRLPGARSYDWYDASYRGGRYLSSEPHVYFLVASRQPLRITRFQRSPFALRTVLGYNSYTSLNYRTVMNDLVGAIVPPQGDDDWTTDVYTVWPRSYRRSAYSSYEGYTRVYCGNGYYDLVPWELYSFACRGYNRRHEGQVSGGGNGNNPPPVRDTTHVNVPGRRRPVPTDSVAAGPGGVTTAEPANGERRRPERRAPEPRREGPRMTDDSRPRVAPVTTSGDDDRPSRPEPRREEPPRESPRQESPRVERPEPRAESPRAEPRSEPRYEAPRSEPRYSAPAPPPPPPPQSPSTVRPSAEP
ncbi:MAG TPA: hypothetical protein VF092_26875 [Longimicrobium sp.]